ncbi:hypothetical protein D3C73_1621690 [compost metagenome]
MEYPYCVYAFGRDNITIFQLKIRCRESDCTSPFLTVADRAAQMITASEPAIGQRKVSALQALPNS